MADSTLPNLTGLTPVADTDEFYVVDKSDTTDSADGTSKKITRANLLGSAAADFTNNIKTDTVSEHTAAAGVTIDSVVLKDGQINTGQGATEVYLMDQNVQTSNNVNFNQVQTDTIIEETAAAGVTIDSLTIKDGVARHGANAIQTTVKARAYLSSNEAIVANTLEKIICDTEDYDPGGNYDNTTGVFTAPIAGYYDIIASAGFAVNTDQNTIAVRIFKNASTLGAATQHGASGTVNQVWAVQTRLKLAAGDTVEMRVVNVTSNDTVLSGTSLTYFDIHLLSVD